MTGDGAVVLEKEIGVLRGASIIMGIILGSGIFVSPAGVLKHTKSVGFSFVMWLVSGFVSSLGAIVYAELGVTMPRSGGEYAYVNDRFGPLFGFLCLWITFILIGGVSCACNALVFAEYLLKLFYVGCEIPQGTMRLVAVICILIIAFINAYSVKWATKMAVIFTVSKIAALLMIIGIGLYYLGLGRTDGFERPFEGSDYSIKAFAMSFYSGFWAYGGWNYLNFLTGEMKNPARNLPMAIIISMSSIILIYLFTNVAYLAVLSLHDLQSIEVAVAGVFATKTMGPAAWLMPLFVSASVFGSINGEFLSMSRLVATGAEDKHFPDVLAMVNYKLLTPIPAVLVMLGLSLGFVFYDDIMKLIELTGFSFIMVSLMAVLSLIHFRVKNPKFNAGFKLPIFAPVAFALIDVILGAITIYSEPKNSINSLLMMLTGIIWYALWHMRPRAIEPSIIRLTRKAQRLMNCVLPLRTELDATSSLQVDAKPAAQYNSSNNSENDVRKRAPVDTSPINL